VSLPSIPGCFMSTPGSPGTASHPPRGAGLAWGGPARRPVMTTSQPQRSPVRPPLLLAPEADRDLFEVDGGGLQRGFGAELAGGGFAQVHVERAPVAEGARDAQEGQLLAVGEVVVEALQVLADVALVPAE